MCFPAMFKLNMIILEVEGSTGHKTPKLLVTLSGPFGDIMDNSLH